MTIFRLENPIQHYDWGSQNAMNQLFGITNESGQPMAELWMGAHPKAPSVALTSGQPIALNNLVDGQAEHLGEGSQDKFGQTLPFLFKVLAAAKPLSIQSHPNKQQALEGFAHENHLGVPLDAFNRNYRDDNHKPELVYALTPFRAMNGFRPLEEMQSLFAMASIQSLVEPLQWLADGNLKTFYEHLMTLQDESRDQLVASAMKFAETSNHPAWQEVARLNQFYPGDIGILSPLLLNVIELTPGEAMFLKAGTLHAYLEGTALEIMACSDNVLRGGLTSKHVDVPELLKTIEFDTIQMSELCLKPEAELNGETRFMTSVDDFLFSVVEPAKALEAFSVNAAEILFCVEGNQVIETADESIELSPGQSCFISANTGQYKVKGSGRLARATSIL
ncbi:mannose-6-phosphate isomerase, class I [Endozoicomonas arenosclerae]|uniref:mannose-6-phosphate isomerase, class I n=1 Tax=Endozoicomonas arenosclerae TaxID=1633495 RepID=UPI000B18BE4F|nr:mannose-6-phosphate isomerase, class I [Endozoicomonas arenosclerae]